MAQPDIPVTRHYTCMKEAGDDCLKKRHDCMEEKRLPCVTHPGLVFFRVRADNAPEPAKPRLARGGKGSTMHTVSPERPVRVTRQISHLALRRASCRGFTLIELLVVIVILGILASIVVPQFMSEPHKARVVQARLQIENFSTALKRFHLDNGYYPSTEQGLEALKKKPSIGRIPKNYPSEGYMNKIPKDPWDNEYLYISPGMHGPFDLISYGADGEEGGTDENADITNWEKE